MTSHTVLVDRNSSSRCTLLSLHERFGLQEFHACTHSHNTYIKYSGIPFFLFGFHISIVLLEIGSKYSIWRINHRAREAIHTMACRKNTLFRTYSGSSLLYPRCITNCMYCSEAGEVNRNIGAWMRHLHIRSNLSVLKIKLPKRLFYCL